MSANAWRRVALVLAAVCVLLTWRNLALGRSADRRGADSRSLHSATSAVPCGDADEPASRSKKSRGAADRSAADREPGHGAADPGEQAPAFRINLRDMARILAPQPGESMTDYRDRMVPLAQDLAAPQRKRVDAARRSFAERARLDPEQLGELDLAVDEAAMAIRDRAFQAVIAGEVMPATFKPTAAVRLAHDLLDIVDRANQRFAAVLTDEQLSLLYHSRFDVADDLLFATRWEDMLGYRDDAAEP